MNAKPLVAAGALIFLGACGGSGSGVSGNAAKLLHAEVAAIRAAAANGDRQTSETQLAQLSSTVAQLRANGQLSAAAAARIASAAQTVESRLSLLVPPSTTTIATTTTSGTTTSTTTTSTTTATTTTTTTAPPDQRRHGNRHGHRPRDNG